MNFEEFKHKFQIVPVEFYPHNVSESPTVTVCVNTYQHADYIKDCLDGILMQETDFSFEILIGEDASTDGTREICIEYAKKYPETIRLILHKRKNNISIGGKPSGRFNFLYTLFSANGEYIALCEGDDYWTDPKKLQKQVDFVKNDTDLSGCFHAYEKIYMGSGKMKTMRHTGEKKFDLGYYLKNNVFMITVSLFFNSKVIRDIPEWYPTLFAGDFGLKYFMLVHGEVGYIDDVMSRYRKGVPGSWSKQKLTQEKVEREFHDNILAVFKINELTNYEYNWDVLNKVMALYSNFIARSITNVNLPEKISLFFKNITLMRVANLKMLTKRLLRHIGLLN